MAKPTLSPNQEKELRREIKAKKAQAEGFADSATLQDGRIKELTIIDSIYSNLFNWYDQDIIAKYDDERKAIDGIFPIDLVTEADLVAVASNPPSGRLVPTPPSRTIVRIPEFDGGTTDSTSLNETADNAEQEIRETYLTSGFRTVTGTQPVTSPGLRTTTNITLASTQVSFEAPEPQAPLFSVGDRFVIHNGTQQCAIEITNIISQDPATPEGGSCSGETPPGSGVDETTCTANGGSWTVIPASDFAATVEFVFLTEGVVNANAEVDADWAGFADIDRVNKNDATDGYNALMTQMIVDLETAINARLVRLGEQETALQANDEEEAVQIAENATALSTVQDSISFLNDYLVNTYIGDADVGLDAGMDSLIAEREAKEAYNITRLSQISTALTTINYDKRYNTANDRGDTAKGTLRELNNAQTVKSDMEGLASNLLEAANSLKKQLP